MNRQILKFSFLLIFYIYLRFWDLLVIMRRMWGPLEYDYDTGIVGLFSITKYAVILLTIFSIIGICFMMTFLSGPERMKTNGPTYIFAFCWLLMIHFHLLVIYRYSRSSISKFSNYMKLPQGIKDSDKRLEFQTPPKYRFPNQFGNLVFF